MAASAGSFPSTATSKRRASTVTSAGAAAAARTRCVPWRPPPSHRTAVVSTRAETNPSRHPRRVMIFDLGSPAATRHSGRLLSDFYWVALYREGPGPDPNPLLDAGTQAAGSPITQNPLPNGSLQKAAGIGPSVRYSFSIAPP